MGLFGARYGREEIHTIPYQVGQYLLGGNGFRVPRLCVWDRTVKGDGNTLAFQAFRFIIVKQAKLSIKWRISAESG